MGCDSRDTSSIYSSGSRPIQFGQITVVSVSHLYNEIILAFAYFMVQLSFLLDHELFQARTVFMTSLQRNTVQISVGISDCYDQQVSNCVFTVKRLVVNESADCGPNDPEELWLY